MRPAQIIAACGLIIVVTLSAGLAGAQAPADASLQHHFGDVGLVAPPPPPGLASSADSDGRGPSQYMAGSVAVRLVLPESVGGVDDSREDWTPAQIAQVRAGVQRSLDWWAAQLPLAQLRFQVRLEVVPTAYEPTLYGLADEGRWISDTLSRMGFGTGSYFDQVYAAGDSLRDELDTDWTTTIFVVNSERGNGYFRDGLFAYAYINGPFMVLTSDVGSYGLGQLDLVAAHELGHIFGALDQYHAARVSCTRRSGYLDTPTTNSQEGECGQSVASIMLDPQTAYAAGAVDSSARAQLGYRDSDGDGTIDPLDTMPGLEIEQSQLGSVSGRPLLRGVSRDQGYPSPFQPIVSINTIQTIEYRVNASAWQPIVPSDGDFDSALERFSLELPLYNGEYLLELRAVNSAGMVSSAVSQQLVVSGVAAQPDYRPTAPAFAREPALSLDLAAPAATQAMQISEDPHFDGANWQPYRASFTHNLSPSEGVKAVYVRFRDEAGRASLAYALPTTLDRNPPAGRATIDPVGARLLLSAQDLLSGVAAVEISRPGGPAVWMPFQNTIALAPGEQELTVRFRDSAGNISQPYQATPVYTLYLPLAIS